MSRAAIRLGYRLVDDDDVDTSRTRNASSNTDFDYGLLVSAMSHVLSPAQRETSQDT